MRDVITHVGGRVSRALGLRIGDRQRAQKFLKRFADFEATGTRQEDDHRLLLSAFLESGGSLLSEAARITSRRSKRDAFDWAPDTLGLGADPVLVRAAVDDLTEHGYAVLPVRVPTSLMKDLGTFVSGSTCKVSSDDSQVNGTLRTVHDGPPVGEKYEILAETVLSCPEIAQLFLDRTLLSIAQDYIGSPPIIDIATAWYSFPSKGPSHEAAQLFHFDLDRVRWLKVFFYLNDVTQSNGAHVFVPGTHRDGGIPRKLLRRGYSRLTDDDVAGFVPEEDWFVATGPAGTILLEDTRGLHKGSQVTQGFRLLAQVQYSASLFGWPSVLTEARIWNSHLGERVPEELRSSLLP